MKANEPMHTRLDAANNELTWMQLCKTRKKSQYVGSGARVSVSVHAKDLRLNAGLRYARFRGDANGLRYEINLNIIRSLTWTLSGIGAKLFNHAGALTSAASPKKTESRISTQDSA